MDLLVLGGTAWLGHQITADAVGRGHAVTCLARGRAGRCAPGTRLILADRDEPGAYDDVVTRQWDAVIDVARQPGQVRMAVTALQPVAGQFLFVSSGNVYASQRELGGDEDSPLLVALTSDVMESMQFYGQAKVACEQAILAGFGPGRSLIARAGLIGGPGDVSGRSGYWPWRFAHPSDHQHRVLVPDDPRVPAAMIDVRDLSAWLLDCAEAGTTGVYNTAGPQRSLSEHLTLARAVAGHIGPVVAAEPGWLTEHQVQMWMGPRSLPLWIDDPDWYGLAAHSTNRAHAAGLVTRPLEDTLTDVLTWEQDRTNPGPHGAGLTNSEEQELLHRLSEEARYPIV